MSIFKGGERSRITVATLRRVGHRCVAASWVATVLTVVSFPAAAAAPALEPHAALVAARSTLEQGDPLGAAAQVTAVLPALAGQPQDQALAWQVLGYAQTAAGDLGAATTSFTSALSAQTLPAPIAHDVTYALARVLISRERHDAGLTYLEQWLSGESKPPLAARQLAAVAYVRSGRCAQAIPHIEAVIRRHNDQRWREALITCREELAQFDTAARLGAAMLRDAPDDAQLWLRAVALRQQAEQHREALALMELAERHGLLDDDQKVVLARMYVAAGIPLKAARLLEEGLDCGKLARSRANLELLAAAWAAARDPSRAVAAYREIVTARPDGNIFYEIGRLESERRHWPEAVEALQQALAQPVLKEIAAAHLLLGVAALQTGDVVLAGRELTDAMKAPATHDRAQWWLQELQSRQLAANAQH